MRILIAGFILVMALPLTGKAQTPGEGQRQEAVPGQSSESLTPGAISPKTSQEGTSGKVDTQSEAYKICLRATQRFEQQEKAKGKAKTAEAPITASCKDEPKPAAYWLCMEKEAIEEVDFNTAHWHCAEQMKAGK
ncbi:MAG: hypothetical protein ACR65R_02430 [Methylomicrobium sp.]